MYPKNVPENVPQKCTPKMSTAAKKQSKTELEEITQNTFSVLRGLRIKI